MLKKKDPLQLAEYTFRQLIKAYDSNDPIQLKLAKNAVDYLVDNYKPRSIRGNTVQWYYGFSYQSVVKIPENWWSGMDGFLIPMTLYAAYQIYGTPRYRDIAIASAKHMLLSPGKGGVVWETECWLSEYVWKSMKPEQDFFVLNGHLYALQALIMLADASKDKDLINGYRCAIADTEKRLPEFIPKGQEWPHYMLNPLTIDPTHYLMYETIQLTALYKLTGHVVFIREAQKRASIFVKYYPIELFRDADNYRLLFSFVGSPHPYCMDIYPIKIECMLPNGKTATAEGHPYNMAKPYDERFFIDIKVPFKPTYCDVTIKYHNYKFPFFCTSSFPSITLSQPTTIPYSMSALLNGIKAGTRKIMIDPSRETLPGKNSYLNTQGNIILETKLNRKDGGMFGITIDTSEDTGMGVSIEDAKGNSTFRYYPKLKKGQRNIILLHWQGFPDIEKLQNEIKKVVIFIYTDKHRKPFSIELGDLVQFSSHLGLLNFFTKNAASYFPQE